MVTLLALVAGGCREGECARSLREFLGRLSASPREQKPSRVKRLYASGTFYQENTSTGPVLAVDNRGVFSAESTFAFAGLDLENWLRRELDQQGKDRVAVLQLDVDHHTFWLRLVQVVSAARAAGWKNLAFWYDTDPGLHPQGPPPGSAKSKLQGLTELSALPERILGSVCPRLINDFLEIRNGASPDRVLEGKLLSCLCRLEPAEGQTLLWYLGRPRPPALALELAEGKENAFLVEQPELQPWQAAFRQVQSAAYSRRQVYFDVLWANPLQPTIPLKTSPPGP